MDTMVGENCTSGSSTEEANHAEIERLASALEFDQLQRAGEGIGGMGLGKPRAGGVLCGAGPEWLDGRSTPRACEGDSKGCRAQLAARGQVRPRHL